MGIKPLTRRKPVAASVLGVGGATLLFVAIVGYFRSQVEATTISFMLFGTFLLIVAAFAARINGTLELSKDGLKVPVGKMEIAEQQIGRGEWVSEEKLGEKVNSLVRVIEPAPSPPKVVTGQDPAGHRDLAPKGRPGRKVAFADNVAIELATLSKEDRLRVLSQFHKMTKPDFDPSADPRAHRPGGEGRAYFVHDAGNGIRIWYREVEQLGGTEVPDLAVLLVDKKGD